MRPFFTLLPLLCRSILADWAMSINASPGGTGIDAAGNIIVAGSSSTDPVIIEDNNRNVLATISRQQTQASNATFSYVYKLSPSKKLLWSAILSSIDGDVTVFGTSLSVDSQSNVFVSGTCNGAVLFFSSYTNETKILAHINNNSRSFVVKINRNGELLWPIFIQSVLQENPGIATAVFKDDRLLLTSFVFIFRHFSVYLADGNIANYTAESDNLVLMKITQNGTMVWSAKIGRSLGWQRTPAIDSQDNIGVHVFKNNLNSYIEITSANNTRSTFGLGSRYITTVAKFSSDGNFLWSNHFFTDQVIKQVWPMGISFDRDGNMIVLNNFEGPTLSIMSQATRVNQTVVTVTTSFSWTVCLSKFSLSGELLWSVPFTGKLGGGLSGNVAVVGNSISVVAIGQGGGATSLLTLFSTNGQQRNLPGTNSRGSLIANYDRDGILQQSYSIDTLLHDNLRSYHATTLGEYFYTGTTDASSISFPLLDNSQATVSLTSGFRGHVWIVDSRSAIKFGFFGFSDQYCYAPVDTGFLSVLSYEINSHPNLTLALPAFQQSSGKMIEIICKQNTCFASLSSVQLFSLDRNVSGDVNFLLTNVTQTTYSCRPFFGSLQITFSSGDLNHANQTLQIPTLYGYHHYLKDLNTTSLFFRARSPDNDDFIFGLEFDNDFMQFEIASTRMLRVVSTSNISTSSLSERLSDSVVAVTVDDHRVLVYQNARIIFERQLVDNVTKVYLSTKGSPAFLDMVGFLALPANISDLLLPPIIESSSSELFTSTLDESLFETTTTSLSSDPTSTSISPTSSTDFSIFGLRGWTLLLFFGLSGGLGAVIVAGTVFLIVYFRRRKKMNGNAADGFCNTTMNTSKLENADLGTSVRPTLVNTYGLLY